MKFEPRALPKDGRMVQAVGIGGGIQVTGKALDMAFERGINYFFWSSTFPAYRNMTEWLKAKFKNNREKIILSTASYFWKFPGSVERIIDRHLRRLETDYIDYAHLGMLRSEDATALDKLVALKEKKKIRHIAASFHNRKLAASLIAKWPQLDLAMIRYSAAHIGAEKEFFPYVDSAKIPVVVFNATKHGSLLKAPRKWDPKKPVPTAADCYRFVLTQPKVTICLAGPSTEDHVKDLFSVLDKGPMSDEEMTWMRDFGKLIYGAP